MKGQVSWFERMAFLAAHPVGEYFWTSSAENPGDKYGGKWTQIKDVFLLAAGGSYAVGSTGGEVKHVLSVDEMPAHNHFVSARSGHTLSTANTDILAMATSWEYTQSTEKGGLGMNTAGSGQPHNNMPPYLAAYCWQRTA